MIMLPYIINKPMHTATVQKNYVSSTYNSFFNIGIFKRVIIFLFKTLVQINVAFSFII